MKMEKSILTIVEKAVQDGIRKGGRAVLKRSNELAPEDDGDLVKSGAMRVDDLTVQVSYNAVHAVVQHERLDYVHEKGQAKFLEQAPAEISIAEYAAAAVRAALSG